MTTRSDIATALSTIDGISGSEFRPSVLTSGNAWAQLSSWDRGPAQAFECNWTIVIVLPQEERSGVTWFESHLEDIEDALSHVVFVDRIEYGPYQADGSTVIAAIVTGKSE